MTDLVESVENIGATFDVTCPGIISSINLLQAKQRLDRCQVGDPDRGTGGGSFRMPGHGETFAPDFPSAPAGGRRLPCDLS